MDQSFSASFYVLLCIFAVGDGDFAIIFQWFLIRFPSSGLTAFALYPFSSVCNYPSFPRISHVLLLSHTSTWFSIVSGRDFMVFPPPLCFFRIYRSLLLSYRFVCNYQWFLWTGDVLSSLNLFKCIFIVGDSDFMSSAVVSFLFPSLLRFWSFLFSTPLFRNNYQLS